MTAQTMRRIRQFHLYLGVFFAPLIIFFALSGALQTFRLQEEKGWGGTPPEWIVYMASVHKDSALPRAKPIAAAEGGGERPVAKAPAPGKSKLPMRIFAVAMSVGLIFSALLGLAIALNSRATRRLSVVMIVAGCLVPILLL